MVNGSELYKGKFKMKVLIDLDKLFDAAFQSMSEPNDCRWTLGNALIEIYYQEFGKELEQRMMDKYAQENLK